MSATSVLAPNPALDSRIAAAAQSAGLHILSTDSAAGTAGAPTRRFTLARTGDSQPPHTHILELSESFDPDALGVAATQELALYLAETTQRLRNPNPDVALTLSGLPLRFSAFAWPFHHSTAGADTSLVHGQASLADGENSPLHAKISASMTVTFRETLRAPEQPFAESFIINAIRKTFDQGQLELVKSGNRQPVPVTTRYYSVKQNKFNFNDTTEPQRTAFLAAKTFWLSGVLGASAPVWLLDPRDAQYLNASVAELKISLEILAKTGLIAPSPDPAYASPTPSLMEKAAEYKAQLQEALAFIKPTFNEDMRAGHTNM